MNIGNFIDYFYVVFDEGENLWPASSYDNPDYQDNSMRAMVNYTIPGDGNEGKIYDYSQKSASATVFETDDYSNTIR